MSSSEKDRRPARLSENALRQLIRTALSRGYIRETPHAEFDHPERNISIEDVIYGLERPDWIIVGDPDFDDEHESYE